jgi:hypothetical protein
VLPPRGRVRAVGDAPDALDPEQPLAEPGEVVEPFGQIIPALREFLIAVVLLVILRRYPGGILREKRLTVRIP